MNGIRWEEKLTVFGRGLLSDMGYDPDHLPTDHNPITEALKQPDFVEKYGNRDGLTRIGLSRVATICQMTVYDHQGGPEQDGEPKSLRRHWYAWYKTHFAQPLAALIGDLKPNGQGMLEMNDLAWSQRLSTTYAEFVDTGEVTYKDLWVEDASRMMESFYDRLFQSCHIVLAVEKDSLFGDFKAAAKALGAVSLYSGKGKSSKAAIELVLRNHFHWSPTYDPFEADPLIILHLTDHDFDGEAVIGPTFADQARRYTGNILEARVGIKPEQVSRDEWQAKWYQVKTSNSGYLNWAERKALFMAQCADCGHQWPVLGLDDVWFEAEACPHCSGTHADIRLPKATPHGFEVEALQTRDYRALLVEALLEVLPFQYILRKLREECVASASSAARQIAEDIYRDNPTYQNLLKEFDRLEKIKVAFEQKVEDALTELGEPHIHDWENEDPDPEPDEFKGWVERAQDWAGPWRPFRTSDRTAALMEYLNEAHLSEIEEMTSEVIEF